MNVNLIYKFIIFIFLSSSYFLFQRVVFLLNDLFPDTRLTALLRIINNNTDDSDYVSVEIRKELIDEALKLFYASPIHVIGLGNFKYFNTLNIEYPHNVHLEVFTETGIVWGTLYVFSILILFISSDKNLKVFLIFFLIVTSLSGDISYLRFLLIIGLGSIIYTHKTKIINYYNN